jgi:hypothetical protein
MSTDLSATAIALGWSHTCAIEADGGVKCWGDNDMGKLGVGSNTNYLDMPAAVPGEPNEARRQGELREEKGNGKEESGEGEGGLEEGDMKWLCGREWLSWLGDLKRKQITLVSGVDWG